MKFEQPDSTDVETIARQLGLEVNAAEAAEYAQLIAGMMPAYQAVADEHARHQAALPVYERSYTRPGPDDNPHNAWFIRTDIQTHTHGALAGKSVAVKDSIMVAGIPMINGSHLLEGYVPQRDAEVIRRILQAGGRIVGKTHCEYLCLSGGSHTNVTGPAHNPWKHGYSTGGSSSGSAVVVATGEVDFALGADQAGSIRMPASYSGVVGLKPTYGLVPYTGCAPIEPTFDHVGPMTRTVRDNAVLLQVIAGGDGVDPRQKDVQVGDYLASLEQGVQGLRIGVVQEGFGIEGSESDVDEKVWQALRTLERLGATVEPVSLPMHALGPAIWLPISMEGLTHTALKTNGFGISRLDDYPVDFMEWNQRHKARLAQAPHNVKLFFLAASWVTQQFGYVPYGQAVNAARRLRAHYDEALARYDLLAMPSTPMKAQPLPGPDAGIAEQIKAATEMFANTAPFDISHHPAISLPCGFSDGLPVGLMLVGKHFDEATIYRAAFAYEQTGEGSGQD